MYEKEVKEIENLIDSQNMWRDKCINLIASENVVSQPQRGRCKGRNCCGKKNCCQDIN